MISSDEKYPWRVHRKAAWPPAKVQGQHRVPGEPGRDIQGRLARARPLSTHAGTLLRTSVQLRGHRTPVPPLSGLRLRTLPLTEDCRVASSIAFARASASLGGTRVPLIPSSTISATPGMVVETMGLDMAAASMRTRGMPSGVRKWGVRTQCRMRRAAQVCLISIADVLVCCHSPDHTLLRSSSTYRVAVARVPFARQQNRPMQRSAPTAH